MTTKQEKQETNELIIKKNETRCVENRFKKHKTTYKQHKIPLQVQIELFDYKTTSGNIYIQ